MPSGLTEVTEITTALGMLAPTLDAAFARQPEELTNVSREVWGRLAERYRSGPHDPSFRRAFENGQVFLGAVDGLRGRRPLLVEWKGRHRPPGDDVIPADLRIDHVYLVSCKYLSKLLSNSGPRRLFDRLLVGEERSTVNWFQETAPVEFGALYAATKRYARLIGYPSAVGALSRDQQRMLRRVLSSRVWPAPLQEPWSALCAAVSEQSAVRWRAAMASQRDRLRLLWRLLRITTATYFVLGTDGDAHLRLRVDSAWDWVQAYELQSFDVSPSVAGQPSVAWRAVVRRRCDRVQVVVDGHVEIRWSHGRFLGSPEAKVYLDTPHANVPGYNRLA